MRMIKNAALFFVIMLSLILTASCAADTSKNQVVKPDLPNWDKIEGTSFSLMMEPGLGLKKLADRFEIGKSFVVTAKETEIVGLAAGDFDAVAPVLEGVVGKFSQIFDTKTTSIGGNKALLVTSTKVNANFHGIFVPLNGKLVSVYTSTLALDKDSETARSVVMSLEIKPEQF